MSCILCVPTYLWVAIPITIVCFCFVRNTNNRQCTEGKITFLGTTYPYDIVLSQTTSALHCIISVTAAVHYSLFPKTNDVVQWWFFVGRCCAPDFLILCCGIICTRCTANKSQYWCLNGTSSFEWHLFISVSVYNSTKGTSPYVSAPYYVFVWIYSYR